MGCKRNHKVQSTAKYWGCVSAAGNISFYATHNNANKVDLMWSVYESVLAI